MYPRIKICPSLTNFPIGIYGRVESWIDREKQGHNVCIWRVGGVCRVEWRDQSWVSFATLSDESPETSQSSPLTLHTTDERESDTESRRPATIPSLASH